MRHTRLISAAVGALFITATAVGCGEAVDAAKEKAGSAVESAKGELESKGAEALDSAKSQGAGALEGLKKKASDALAGPMGSALDKIDPELKGQLQEQIDSSGVDLQVENTKETESDPVAVAAESYFAARQAAFVTGDMSTVEKLSNPKMLKRATNHIKKFPKQKGQAWTIKAVGVEGDVAQLCIGPKGQRPKAVTVQDGKVVNAVKGDHSCA